KTDFLNWHLQIDFDIVARLAWNRYHRCYFYYFGRKNKAGTVTTVKFSQYEGRLILDFVSRVLDQIAAHPEPGKHFTDLIPFFDTNPTRAHVSIRHDHRAELWTDPDLELDTVRVRLVFNRVSGQYAILMNNKVSDVVSKRLKNWQGPQMTLALPAVRNLEAYLSEVSVPALEQDTQEEETS
ncbi:unnamed protein product, partial [Allacma fusca]